MDSESIISEVRQSLDALDVKLEDARAKWTRAVLTKLCEIGKRRGCWVAAASSASSAIADGGGWLYDVTWLEYDGDFLTASALVAECEWNSGLDYIDEDFQKLLLARASVRLMIFDGGDDAGAVRVASHLAGQVAAFRCSRNDDAWLFAAWVSDDNERGWSFRWFTISDGRPLALQS